MDDYLEDTEGTARAAEAEEESLPLESRMVDFDDLLRSDSLEDVGQRLSEGALEMADFMRKDVIDRFLEFVFFKVQTGNMDIPSMAYPTRRMLDGELEKKIIELINVHLYPEIIFRLLKFFTRNLHDADTNLYIANLVYSEDIIKVGV